jgi:toxin ParE1/3/4
VRPKRIVRRARAERDINGAAAHYGAEGGTVLELRFVGALQTALRHVAANPASGSPRYGHELNVPGLRCWPLARFPYLIFYVERADHVDVWRVLHQSRDIPAWLRDPGPGD